MKREKIRLQQSVGVSVLLLAVLFLLPLAVIVPVRQEHLAQQAQTPFVPGELDSAVTLKVLCGDTVEEMTMGEYLVGVVRAEMPASFAQEALKAQAVAARTYTRHKLLSGGNHGDTADICTDSTCCQAYISEEQARKNWGSNADIYEEKVERAVRETDGETILYEGVPVLAVFHSSSAGLTRPAGEVWRDDLPYLRSVVSPEKEDAIPNYHSRVEFTREALLEKLHAAFPEAELSGDMGTWLSDPVTDSAGSVLTVRLGGQEVKGTAVRSALGLRSACFQWEVQDEKLVFFVTGFGHGVGMSQYGANAMAEQGKDHREILTHYYTGTVVEPYRPGLH